MSNQVIVDKSIPLNVLTNIYEIHEPGVYGRDRDGELRMIAKLNQAQAAAAPKRSHKKKPHVALGSSPLTEAVKESNHA